MSTQPKFAEIEDVLLEGVKSLKKWFHRAETTSGAYFICLVLNPGIKDVYFRAHWGDEEYKAGMEAFEEAFDRYSAANHDNEDTEMSTAPVEAKPAPLARYGSSFLMDAVNSVQQAERARAHPREELKGICLRHLNRLIMFCTTGVIIPHAPPSVEWLVTIWLSRALQLLLNGPSQVAA
ncbi:hypothetical protein B0H10DRAFT_1915667 [Mycena sp. CBHHK59/15]|nr:hypothetical protein B0H10DRAFT_1915667 [Mycena sp. CBHHK59/15]